MGRLKPSSKNGRSLLGRFPGKSRVATALAVLLFAVTPVSNSLGNPIDEGPSFDDILDTTPSIPLGEELQKHDLNLPAQMSDVIVQVTADERQEVSTWVKWLVLKNLPPNFEDNRGWDKKKEVVTGLHLHREGLKIETKRKRKMVKQGTWTRYMVEFIDPENQLVIDITKVAFPVPGQIEVSCRVEAPLKLFGRVSQWQRDVQLYSLSTTGKARVAMTMNSQIQIRVNPLLFPPEIEFVPKVTDAHVRLQTFEVDRISRIGGDAAELVGKGLRKVLDDKLEEYDEKLVEKMNREIDKQKDKLRISLSDWFTKKLSERAILPN